MKSCSRCRRALPPADFFRRAEGSSDGRQSFCKDCDYQRKVANGSLDSGPHSKTKYGSKSRARTALNRRVSTGIIPRPDSLACYDCGGPARHYDHHRGYEGRAAYDVQPVCTRCHGLRGRKRGEFRGNGGTGKEATLAEG